MISGRGLINTTTHYYGKINICQGEIRLCLYLVWEFTFPCNYRLHVSYVVVSLGIKSLVLLRSTRLSTLSDSSQFREVRFLSSLISTEPGTLFVYVMRDTSPLRHPDNQIRK